MTPISWPIGSGQRFLGCYDLKRDRLALMERVKNKMADEGEVFSGTNDPKLDQFLPESAVKTLREEVEMARGLCPPFDLEEYRGGHMTPVFFGSAINNTISS